MQKAIDYITNPSKTEAMDLETEMMAIERVLEEKDVTKVAFDYITKEDKTNLVIGINCTPETAPEEMSLIKSAYGKTGGRQFVHFVQSFHPEGQVSSQQAHEIAVRLAKEFKRFSGFQIVVGTHTDRDHLHSHFIVNSVNMETGLKWQQSPAQLEQLKEFSDELCREYGLSTIIQKDHQKESDGEIRATERGASWKHELRLAVDACMKNSTSRDNFISNMVKLGYQVNWTDTRKYITFITPEGHKCRNIKLDESLTKEAFQEAFLFNKEFGNPQAMAAQIKQLEMATQAAKTIEDEVIPEITNEETEKIAEEEPLITSDSEDHIAHKVEWSERYKRGRVYLYGSEEVEQDFVKAYRLFLEEAKNGNALAMHDLGRMHADGLGMDIDMAKSYEWYAKALTAFMTVESEDPRAYTQYRIGKMYAAGLGTAQSYEDAANWFGLAVAQNHKYAQYSLGGLYYRGQGVEQSYETAFSLYGKSAVQGNPYADYELAKMWRDGLGTLKNSSEADLHFRIAFSGFSALEAKSHDDKLQYRLGQMLYSGTGTEKDIPKAVEYLKKSAKTGNVNAQYLLAKIYLEVDSNPENIKEALILLNKAATGGNALAQYALAKVYLEGKHIEKDISKAVELFTLSAEQNNQYAAYTLGKINLKGEVMPKNIENAIKWLSLSADQSNQFAQYTLGKLYMDGTEVPRNSETGLKLLTASAEKGNQFAQFQLGKHYLSGKVLPRDKALAEYWLKESAAQGNEFAQMLLDGHQSELDLVLDLMHFFSTPMPNNKARSYPLSALEGQALREAIKERKMGSKINWERKQGYDR